MDKVPQSKPTSTWLRSMTRLMIGGVEVGLSMLLNQIESWDRELAGNENQGAENTSPPGKAESSVEQGASTQAEESPQLHQAMVGLFFEMQDSLLKGIDVLDRSSRAASRMGEPWLRPLRESKLLRPLRRQVDRLAARGETEIMHWVERGRRETEQSRKLVETAISSTVEHGIETLTTNPEVQELVQKQSTGLANEVLEEVRERTVSADNFLEGIARRLLRRRPRQQLAEPPVEVIERATAARSQKGKRAPLQ
ncbi:MAG: hypothetical protein A2Z49_06735 [Chloroflexi bacterium RBG_19FT_COMBO_56_12]|nr:MAG: hypothetical protein A2Z49_06735 [Chloroflexi bacterium RBG_19FT_COMBO_56_12]